MTKDNAAGVKSICITEPSAATGAVEITWPIAAIAMAYIAGQTVVDVTELLPESGPSLAVSHRFSLVFVDTASIDCK